MKDVRDILALLQRDYDLDPDCVVSLFDERATRNNIIIELDKLKAHLLQSNREQPVDKLIIYYSGHGHLDEYGKGFWIPTDAERENTAHYIRNSTIRDYIEDFRTKHTLLISDSCFSGALFYRHKSASAGVPEKLEKRLSRWIFSSGRKDEKVDDGKPGKNSPFAASILQVLRDNELAKLKAASLINEVTERTSALSGQLPEGAPLRNAGDDGGQYIFCRKDKHDEDWERTRKKHSLPSYLSFVKKYTDSRHIPVALGHIKALEEERKWRKCQKRDTIAAYVEYTLAYPNGQFSEQAHQRMDELVRKDADKEQKPEVAEQKKHKDKTITRQAIKWYRKAAQEGHAESQNNLGLLYHRGHGLPKDMEKALFWIRKSAKQGYEVAQKNLPRLDRKEQNQGQKRGLLRRRQRLRRGAPQRSSAPQAVSGQRQRRDQSLRSGPDAHVGRRPIAQSGAQ